MAFWTVINNITVTASNTAICPSGGATCYSATITGYVPVLLSQVIGYKGTDNHRGHTADRAPGNRCRASRPDAAVSTVSWPRDRTASPSAQTALQRRSLKGCNIMSNAGARCNGNNLGADYGDAAGTNDGCGVIQRLNVPPACRSLCWFEVEYSA